MSSYAETRTPAWVKIFHYAVAFIVLGVTIANIFLTGHIPGVPFWIHWIAGAGLGPATWTMFHEAVTS